jgi:hypothetical protein
MARKLSGLERIWLAADRIRAPFVNQWVLEGEGTPDLGALEAAVRAVAEVRPLTAARLAGFGRGLRWVAGGAPPRVRAADDWSEAPLDPRRGPIAEVIWAPRARQLVFRTHHAAFDGRGATLWAEAVLRAVRGEPLDIDADIDVDDRAPAHQLHAQPTTEPPADRPAPLGVTDAPLTVCWANHWVPGAPRQVLPRLLVALAEVAGAEIRVSVPVDLRRHLTQGAQLHNLTGVAYVEVAPGESVAVIRARVREAVTGPGPAGHALAAHGVRGIPVGVIAAVGRRAAQRHLRAERWPVSAVVSNLGRQDLAAMAGGGFVPKRGFWVPPGSPGLPLFLTAAGDDAGVSLCAAAPRALGGDGLPALLVRLGQALDVAAG